MPVQACVMDGRPGWRWGSAGKCYTGPGARAKAEEQGAAIEAEKRIDVAVAKVDDERRLVYGWFSVIAKDGQQVVDLQNDAIGADTLRKAAHDFMLRSRTAGDMHQLEVGHVVESVVLTEDVQAALGIDLGKVGWFGAVRVDDAGVWNEVRKGGRMAFSIGGTGIRKPLQG